MIYAVSKARFIQGGHLHERKFVENFKTFEAAEIYAKQDRKEWDYIGIAEYTHMMEPWPTKIKEIKKTTKYAKKEEELNNEWEKIHNQQRKGQTHL